MIVGDKMYRYVDTLYSTGGGDDYSSSSVYVKVVLLTYNIVRLTPKGAWVSGFPGDKPRFVLNSARKRFACPTKEEAMTSFVARKNRQIRILTSQLQYVKEALAQVGQPI